MDCWRAQVEAVRQARDQWYCDSIGVLERMRWSRHPKESIGVVIFCGGAATVPLLTNHTRTTRTTIDAPIRTYSHTYVPTYIYIHPAPTPLHHVLDRYVAAAVAAAALHPRPRAHGHDAHTLAGFKKGVNRATTQVLMKTGQVERTNDRDYETELRHVPLMASAIPRPHTANPPAAATVPWRRPPTSSRKKPKATSTPSAP